MSDTAKIAEALAAFQAEMPVVHKGNRADVPTKSGGKYSYTYADLSDVSAAAMPILTKHGLSFSTCPRQTERGYELAGLLLHTSGERLEGALPVAGNNPQELGSSLTYMRRYLLGCMTGIVTDDDDDAQSVQPARAAKKTAAKPAADGPIKAATRGRLFALFTQKGIAEGEQLAGANHILGKAYESRSEFTEADARLLIERLEQRPDAPTGAPS